MPPEHWLPAYHKSSPPSIKTITKLFLVIFFLLFIIIIPIVDAEIGFRYQIPQPVANQQGPQILHELYLFPTGIEVSTNDRLIGGIITLSIEHPPDSTHPHIPFTSTDAKMLLYPCSRTKSATCTCPDTLSCFESPFSFPQPSPTITATQISYEFDLKNIVSDIGLILFTFLSLDPVILHLQPKIETYTHPIPRLIDPFSIPLYRSSSTYIPLTHLRYLDNTAQFSFMTLSHWPGNRIAFCFKPPHKYVIISISPRPPVNDNFEYIESNEFNPDGTISLVCFRLPQLTQLQDHIDLTVSFDQPVTDFTAPMTITLGWYSLIDDPTNPTEPHRFPLPTPTKILPSAFEIREIVRSNSMRTPTQPAIDMIIALPSGNEAALIQHLSSMTSNDVSHVHAGQFFVCGCRQDSVNPTIGYCQIVTSPLYLRQLDYDVSIGIELVSRKLSIFERPHLSTHTTSLLQSIANHQQAIKINVISRTHGTVSDIFEGITFTGVVYDLHVLIPGLFHYSDLYFQLPLGMFLHTPKLPLSTPTTVTGTESSFDSTTWTWTTISTTIPLKHITRPCVEVNPHDDNGGGDDNSNDNEGDHDLNQAPPPLCEHYYIEARRLGATTQPKPYIDLELHIPLFRYTNTHLKTDALFNQDLYFVRYHEQGSLINDVGKYDVIQSDQQYIQPIFVKHSLYAHSTRHTGVNVLHHAILEGIFDQTISLPSVIVPPFYALPQFSLHSDKHSIALNTNHTIMLTIGPFEPDLTGIELHSLSIWHNNVLPWVPATLSAYILTTTCPDTVTFEYNPHSDAVPLNHTRVLRIPNDINSLELRHVGHSHPGHDTVPITLYIKSASVKNACQFIANPVATNQNIIYGINQLQHPITFIPIVPNFPHGLFRVSSDIAPDDTIPLTNQYTSPSQYPIIIRPLSFITNYNIAFHTHIHIAHVSIRPAPAYQTNLIESLIPTSTHIHPTNVEGSIPALPPVVPFDSVIIDLEYTHHALEPTANPTWIVQTDNVQTVPIILVSSCFLPPKDIKLINDFTLWTFLCLDDEQCTLDGRCVPLSNFDHGTFTPIILPQSSAYRPNVTQIPPDLKLFVDYNHGGLNTATNLYDPASPPRRVAKQGDELLFVVDFPSNQTISSVKISIIDKNSNPTIPVDILNVDLTQRDELIYQIPQLYSTDIVIQLSYDVCFDDETQHRTIQTLPFLILPTCYAAPLDINTYSRLDNWQTECFVTTQRCLKNECIDLDFPDGIAELIVKETTLSTFEFDIPLSTLVSPNRDNLYRPIISNNALFDINIKFIPTLSNQLSLSPSTTVALVYYPLSRSGTSATTPTTISIQPVSLSFDQFEAYLNTSLNIPRGFHALHAELIISYSYYDLTNPNSILPAQTIRSVPFSIYSECLTPPNETNDYFNTSKWISRCVNGTCGLGNRCYCDSGWDGQYCDKPQVNTPNDDDDDDEITLPNDEQPCQHCNPDNTDSCDQVNNTCICKPEFGGINCEMTLTCLKSSHSMCHYPHGSLVPTSNDPCGKRCKCSKFWSGASCNHCSVICHNGGLHTHDCGGCGCPEGFGGTTCQCRSSQISITLDGYSQWILAFIHASAERSGVQHDDKASVQFRPTPTQHISSTESSNLYHENIYDHISDIDISSEHTNNGINDNYNDGEVSITIGNISIDHNQHIKYTVTDIHVDNSTIHMPQFNTNAVNDELDPDLSSYDWNEIQFNFDNIIQTINNLMISELEISTINANRQETINYPGITITISLPNQSQTRFTFAILYGCQQFNSHITFNLLTSGCERAVSWDGSIEQSVFLKTHFNLNNSNNTIIQSYELPTPTPSTLPNPPSGNAPHNNSIWLCTFVIFIAIIAII